MALRLARQTGIKHGIHQGIKLRSLASLTVRFKPRPGSECRLHSRYLPSFARAVYSRLLNLCWSKLAASADDSRVVNVGVTAEALAWDVVGELAYGSQFGHLRTDSDEDGIREKNSGAFWISANLGHLWGRNKLVMNALTNAIAILGNTESPVEAFLGYVRRKVIQRQEQPTSPSDRHDMLAYFLQMKSLDGTEPASVTDMVMEAVNIT